MDVCRFPDRPRRALRRILLGACLLLVAQANIAWGERLLVERSGPPMPEVGDQIEFQISGSEFASGVDGGDFAIVWSPNLALVGVAVPDPPWDLSTFEEPQEYPGLLRYVDVFSFLETPGVAGGDFEIAHVTFEAIESGPGYISIIPTRAGWSLAGSSLSFVLFPDPLSFEIIPAPSPDIGTLLGPGILLLTGLGRTRTRGNRRAGDGRSKVDHPHG